MTLSEILGVRLGDDALTDMALTHRSYAFEQGIRQTNERLEFLGDAVLGLVVTDLAFRELPDRAEGELAKLRAAVVSMDALADVARGLGLGALLHLGKGEEMSGGRDKSSILADCLEAVLGAVYLDLGLDEVAGLITRLFKPRMDAWVRGEGGRDYKTDLQEYTSAHFGSLPDYQISERGPDHLKEFSAKVLVGGTAWGAGAGRSKKEAEQAAAAEAINRLAKEPEGRGV